MYSSAWTGAAWAQAPDPARWNKTFTNPNASFNRNPNAFLVETVKPWKPGRALVQAATAGVKLNAVLGSADEFDYGHSQWDLIIGIFMHEIFTRNADKIIEGLKPGGLVVVEGFRDGALQAAERSKELLRVFDRLRVTHKEVVTAPACRALRRPEGMKLGRRVTRWSPARCRLPSQQR